MQYIKHSISFQLLDGSVADDYITEFSEKINALFTISLGLTRMENTGLIDGPDTTYVRQRIQTYKLNGHTKPYIFVNVFKHGASVTANNNNIYCAIGITDATGQWVANSGYSFYIVHKDSATTTSVSYILHILKSDNFLLIDNSNNADLTIANIGKQGVLLGRAKNPFTGGERPVFGDTTTLNILSVNTVDTKKIKYLEDDEFKVLGALSAPDTTSTLHFMNQRLILIPAFISESYTKEVYFKDWYLDGVLVTLTGSLVTGNEYVIDNRTYLAINERALVEITEQ